MSASVSHPIRVNAFVNGEATLPAQTVVVTSRGLTFDVLMDRLTSRLRPKFGAVRRLYSLEGTRIGGLDQITDDLQYVVAGSEPFKNVKYGDALPSQMKKEKTVTTQAGHTEAAKPSPRVVSEGKATKIVSKPKIVFVLRNGELTGQPFRILLPQQIDMEHALFMITDRVKLDSGAVRKLYTMQGHEVTSLDDIADQECYIACGREQLRPIDAAARVSPTKAAVNSKSPPRQQHAPNNYGAHISVQKFDAVEKDFKDMMSNPARSKDLAALWTTMDFNGNGIVSLAEIDKAVVEKYPLLNNKPALMRAYRQTTLRDGDGDAYVERNEFPALLRNLIYFNKLFVVFEGIDKDDDRRLTFDEFQHGLSLLNISLDAKKAREAFDGMDSNDGGIVLFDEFCAWVAINACPVDGEVVRAYTTSTDPISTSPTKGAAKGGKAGAPAGAGAGGSSKPSISVHQFDAIEKNFKDMMSNPARTKDLATLWTSLDFNGNGIVSLAEIDKIVVEKYPQLNNKPALMRAYRQTTLRDGDGDAYVERNEFPALLRNLVYFNKLFVVFDGIDKDDDRRLTFDEFQHGLSLLNLKLDAKKAREAFDSMDSNHGGIVLFDEFCAWVANSACPVDGEVVRAFTTATEPMGASPTKGGAPKAAATKDANGGKAAQSPTPGSNKPSISAHQFDAVEKEFKDLMSNPARSKDLAALWASTDFNGNGIVSLAEIDKVVVEKYPLLNNKPALMRAYRQTTLRDGDGDAYVERNEFPALLRNLVYFNKLFVVFDGIDKDDDRRLTFDEFQHGLSLLNMKLDAKKAREAFDGMDSNHGGIVLFDEFCAWVANNACPVDGEVVRAFTTATEPANSKTQTKSSRPSEQQEHNKGFGNFLNKVKKAAHEAVDELAE